MKKIILILFILLFIPNLTLAWNDCPFGLINDPAPGSCGRFIDTDRDGFCDHSQLAPEKRKIALSENDTEKDGNQAQKKKVGYRFFSILIALFLLYAVSLTLVKQKVISSAVHRKIWNILLLVNFLASAVLGLLLVLRTNYSLDLILPFNLLYWHVEIGIAMAAIAIFHIIWHRQYFISMVKKNK